MKLNVGVLTMHRVANFGSILQAYATQAIIEKLGHSCTIIDYVFPNNMHRISKGLGLKMYSFFKNLLLGFPEYKKQKGLNSFIKNKLNLTIAYNSRESLIQQPPAFDKYIVGSDQTWNTACTRGDDTFLLNFIDSTEKLAFASSAAHSNIDPCFERLFRDNLKKFKFIAVRDNNTKILVKNLLGQDVPIVLDPTLLLNSTEWNRIANISRIAKKIKGAYILIYILSYSFDPYPFVNDVIRRICDEFSLPLVIIRYSMKQRLEANVMHNFYEGISPEDFIWLFSNASFVITTSFHGTAFAINFNKPFYTIYNPLIQDDRIYSLLELLGCESSGIPNNGIIPQNYVGISDYAAVNNHLDIARLKSIELLKKALSA